MNFDEMDIEPNIKPSAGYENSQTDAKIPSKVGKVEDEELQTQLLKLTVPLDDGTIGYVFTYSENRAIVSWRCHVCIFLDMWKNFKAHLHTQRHESNMLKSRHPRSNFTKVENCEMVTVEANPDLSGPSTNGSQFRPVIPNLSTDQPLPLEMEDDKTGSCQIFKSLKTFNQSFIGLEYLLELQNCVKEPQYLCLLCDKKGDPRTILYHLTSQNHYMRYLRKYFPKFASLLDKLPKSNDCRANLSNIISHLIAKLEEKYGRLQPTATNEDEVISPKQRSMLLQKIIKSDHFRESAEDATLEGMLTVEYVRNPQLLQKNFPLNPKHVNTEKSKQDSKSLVNENSKTSPKRNTSGIAENVEKGSESPNNVVFVGITKNAPAKNGLRSRKKSPFRSKESSLRRSPVRMLCRSRDRSFRRSPVRSRDRSLCRSPIRTLQRSRERSFYRSRERSLRRSRERSPFRSAKRSPFRRRSPIRGQERSRSRFRSPPAEHRRGRYVSPLSYRTPRYRPSWSPSPGRRSRSPIVERYRRSPSPYNRSESPLPLRYGGHRYRSPETEIRRVIAHSSPSPLRYRKRSRSRGQSPLLRSRRSQSRSRPRDNDIKSRTNPSASVHDSSKIEERRRSEASEPEPNSSLEKEVEELKKRMNRVMDGYIETPESHPAYQDEWKKFWCAKFKKLRKEGKEDPFKYDYKPEWIIFWNVRVKVLFVEEFESKMNALKKKYQLSDSKKEEKPVGKVSSKSSSIPKKQVLDVKTKLKEPTNCNVKDDPIASNRRSLSPWESDDLSCQKGALKDAKNGSISPISGDSLSSISDTKSPRCNPCQSRSRSKSISPSKVHSISDEYPFKNNCTPWSKKIHFDNPLNIITVLRQLSVLELQLGSHANHVIQLLTSGLSMERIKPQSSMDLLTEENILFLELVKEKLKGQLLASIVPKTMVKATLFCIKNIDELMDVVPKLEPTEPPPIPAPLSALLYGAGSDQMGAALPAAAPFLCSSHVSGQPFSDYSNLFGHFDGGINVGIEHNPFGRTSPKLLGDMGGADHNCQISDEFALRNNNPVVEEKPNVAVEEISIDKKLIALQIAEVLTQQNRSDVSNAELQTLIDMVAENLKQEQKKRTLQGTALAQSADPTTPAILNALATLPIAPTPNLGIAADPPNPQPAISASSNLNDSSKTPAALQDICVNESAAPNTNKPSVVEDLTEADIIEMLRNFKSIPRMKQENLIKYLRKLEATEPERVEELKKYVNAR